MNDREFENYLVLLGGMLRLRRTQRDSISGELRDHLIEHVAHLEASGITHEEAVRRALEEFGDAAALAAGFSALVGMRRRRLIMRCTIGTTIFMTGLVIAMWAFRPPVIDDPQVAQAQGESNAGEKASTDRAKVGRGRTARSASPDEAAREKLKEHTDVEFNEVPLLDALKYLSDRHQVQFYIDKRSLSDAGVPADAPTTFQLKAVPLDMVLDLMLRENQLGYRIRNGVVVIASESDIQSQTDVRVYRVPEGMAGELAALIPATIATDHWREQVQMQIHGLGGAAGNMPGMMGGAAGAPGMPAGPGATGEGFGGFGGGGIGGGFIADPMGGGGSGMIRVFRGTLVIAQTPEVHQKIEKLIEDLTSAGAMEPQRGAAGYGAEGGYGRGTGGYGGSRAPADGAGYGRTAPGYGATGGIPGSGLRESGRSRASGKRTEGSSSAEDAQAPDEPSNSGAGPAEDREGPATGEPSAGSPPVDEAPGRGGYGAGR
jgi:hypothetical protein